MRHNALTNIVVDNINRHMATAGHSNASLAKFAGGRITKSTIGRMRIKLLFERDQWAKLTEHKRNALE